MRLFKRKRLELKEDNLILDRHIFNNYFFFIRRLFNTINLEMKYANYYVCKKYLFPNIQYEFHDDYLIMAYDISLRNYKLSEEIFTILSYDHFCTKFIFLTLEDFRKIQEKEIMPSWIILLNRAKFRITRYDQEFDLLGILDRFDDLIFLQEEIKPRSILSLKKGKVRFEQLEKLKDLENLRINNNRTRMHD